MQTKNLNGINNKTNGVGVVRMYVSNDLGYQKTPNEPCPPATISFKSS